MADRTSIPMEAIKEIHGLHNKRTHTISTAHDDYERRYGLIIERCGGLPSPRALDASYRQWVTDYDNAHTWPDGEQVDG